MQLNNITERQGSWTRININFSYASLESMKILIQTALENKELVIDNHTEGFILEFLEIYGEANKRKGYNDICQNNIGYIKEQLKNVKVIELD